MDKIVVGDHNGLGDVTASPDTGGTTLGTLNNLKDLGVDVAQLPSDTLNTLILLGLVGGLGYTLYRVGRWYKDMVDERHLSNATRIAKLEETAKISEVEKSTCLAELRLITDKFNECMDRLMGIKDA